MTTTVFTNEEISLLDRLETAAFESIIFSHCSIEKAHRANVEKSDAEEELKQIAMLALQNGDNSRIKALRAEMDARIDYGTANARKIEHEAGDYITGKLTYQPLGNNSVTAEEEPAKADEIIACIDDYIVDVDAATECEEDIRKVITMKKYEITKEFSVEVSSSLLGKSYYVYKDGKHIATFNEGGTFDGKGGDVNLSGKWRNHKSDDGFNKSAAQYNFSKQDVVDAVTFIENPEKANIDIIACIDDYIVDVDAATECEIEISAIKKNIYPEDTEILIQQIQDKIEINQYCVAQCEKDIQRIQNDIKATVEKEVSRIADYMSKIILLTVKKDSLSSQITRYKILKNLFDTQRNIRGCIKNGEFDSAENFANCAKILLSVPA